MSKLRTTQSTPGGVAGFRCAHCQTDVWRLICRKCKNVTSVHGTVSGAGSIEFRCAKCRARNQFPKQQLRAIWADVRRAQRAESALRRQSAADQKHAKVVYLVGRQEEVDELNSELQARFDELRSNSVVLARLKWSRVVRRATSDGRDFALQPSR